MNDNDEQLESRLRNLPLPGLSDPAKQRLLADLVDDTDISPSTAVHSNTGHSDKEIVMSQSKPNSKTPQGSGNPTVVAVCVIVLAIGAFVVFNRGDRHEQDVKMATIDTSSMDGTSDSNLNSHQINDLSIYGGNRKAMVSNPQNIFGPPTPSRSFFEKPPSRAFPNQSKWPRGGRIVGLSAPNSFAGPTPSGSTATGGGVHPFKPMRRHVQLNSLIRSSRRSSLDRYELGFRMQGQGRRSQIEGYLKGLKRLRNLQQIERAKNERGLLPSYSRTDSLQSLLRGGTGLPALFGKRFDGRSISIQIDGAIDPNGEIVPPVDPKGKPNSKKKPAKKKAKQPTVEEYTSKEVEAVRKHFIKQFQQLAKANPQRELAIMRVKGRVETRLKAIEQQVALAKRIGKPIAAVEGRVVVAEVVKAEVKGLDVDGDGRADFGNESYETIVENKFLTPLADPLSTLSIDVDTASFANTRRFISQGLLPPKDAVRIEELVNYFNYDYTPPKSTSKDPFSVTLEMGTCPWNTKHKLVMVGLKGRELPHDKRPAANLVFLIDVSGSMSSAKKLPLVKLALEMLVDQLQPKDRVSIVTYSNSARTVLEPTAGSERVKILNAIHALRASGGTNGAAGIQLAYTQAQKNFFKAKDGTNRVILCTDGDFNVGIKDTTKLVEFVRGKANKGVFLSVFGFGMGNLKDKRLETLTNKGNGNYGYIDGFNEAKKVFVEEMSGTLFTIAKDVKIQVEFNPGAVASYRLIGYENRIMAAQDFNNDKKDAGEIGAGHTVTALYEIIPATPKTKPTVDKLKYQTRVAPKKGEAKEVLTVKLRYKQPDADKSTKIEFPLKASTKKAAPSESFEFAAAVAMYGLLLRDSKYAGNANLDLVRELAAGAMGKDAEGHRSDFLKLVHKTRTLVARQLGGPVPAPRAFEAGKIGGKK